MIPEEELMKRPISLIMSNEVLDTIRLKHVKESMTHDKKIKNSPMYYTRVLYEKA